MKTKAYVLCPISVIFDVAGLLAVWGDDRSWGPSVRCSFGLFNGGVVVGVPVDNVKRCGSVTSGWVFLDVPSGHRKVPVVGWCLRIRGKGAGSVRGNRWCTGLMDSDRKWWDQEMR